MMRRRRIALAYMVVGFGLLAGCRPDLDGDNPAGLEFQEISGVWSYSASSIVDEQNPDLVCETAGLTLTLEKIKGAGAFWGHTSEGSLQCADRLGGFAVPLQPFPISNGYTFNQFLAFDIYNANWRHDGRIQGDSIGGTFVLRSGVHRFRGNFVALRRRTR